MTVIYTKFQSEYKIGIDKVGGLSRRWGANIKIKAKRFLTKRLRRIAVCLKNNEGYFEHVQ
jgi:hypothetical protein